MANLLLEIIIALTFIIWLASIIRLIFISGKLKTWLMLLIGIIMLFLASSLDVIGDVADKPHLAFLFKNFSYAGGVVLFSAGFLQMSNKILKDMKELEHLTNIDELTQLLNRRGFLQHLVQEIDRSQRLNLQFDLLVLDVNNFKIINDSYGHAIGDEVLKKVAGCLKNELRSYDIIGRIGGDEFAVFLPDTCLEKGQETVERLKKALTKAFAETQYKVAIAVGISCFPSEADTVNKLFMLSDKRMYTDKRNEGQLPTSNRSTDLI